jgi:hypothetical protein
MCHQGSSYPVVPVEDIGLPVIQAPKPEPRIMRFDLRTLMGAIDKLAANYLAFIELVSIRIWLRASESML